MAYSCSGKDGDTSFTSSALFHKQDQFWENIISKYENAIKQLKIDEFQMQEHLFELKVLIQGILTFNLVKLLDKGGDPELINHLVKLKCICPKNIPEEKPINTNNLHCIFNIETKDIKHMTTIKELINREKYLIDEVNKLRIKDTVLVQMKIDIDTLMKSSFPGMRGSLRADSGSPSDLPREIQVLLKENRTLSEELYDLKKENRKSEDSINGALGNELRRLQTKNGLLEREVAKMKRELNDMMRSENMAAMEDILCKNKCLLCDLRHLVATLQGEVNVLKYSIVTMQAL